MKILVRPRSVTRSNGHPSLKPIKDAGCEVVLSTPGTLPGEDELLKLLPGCIGYLAGVGIFDQDAVLATSASGKISGIGVDAFDPEPPEDWRITLDSRVIATPHIGGYTDESIERAMSVAVDNLLHALASANNDTQAKESHD
jgi:hypothetical protein